MSADRVHKWFQRIFYLSLGLIMLMQFPGDLAHAAAPQATTISLHMSNPSCVRAPAASATCALQIHNLSATGSDASFSRVEILVNGKLRVFMSGFFESSAYYVDHMVPGGLKVPCGWLNSGGKANYGNVYVVTANAYMADGTTAQNSMSVFCPAYGTRTFLPVTRK